MSDLGVRGTRGGLTALDASDGDGVGARDGLDCLGLSID